MQTWFIFHAIKVKNETFQRNVKSALEHLALRLEEREAFIFIKKEGFADTENIPFKVKSLSPEALKPFDINNKDNYSEDTYLRHFHHHKRSEKEAEYTAEINDKDSLASIYTPENVNRCNKENKLLQKMAVDLSLRNKPLSQRMNFAELDTLINHELENENITVPCKFGIIQSSNDSMVFSSKGADKDELAGTEYKAQLFPDDFFMKPNFLMVYFPEKNLYLLKNITIVLGSSSVFLFVIVQVFNKHAVFCDNGICIRFVFCSSGLCFNHFNKN